MMLSSLPTMLELGYFDLATTTAWACPAERPAPLPWARPSAANVVTEFNFSTELNLSTHLVDVLLLSKKPWQGGTFHKSDQRGRFHDNISSSLPWLSTARTLRVG